MHADAAFLRNYVLRGGIRDGTAGLIVSLLNAYYVALKFVKLWELGRKSEVRSQKTEVRSQKSE